MDVRRLVLRIPGEWEDAWLYRENLLIWDRSGALHHVGLDSLRSQIAQVSDHHHRVLADHLVLRSERKSSREFQDLLAIPSVRRQFFAPLTEETEAVVTIPLTQTNLRPASIEATPGNITDTVAYGNRIFSASDAGLYESQFDSRYDEYSILHQVTDKPATTVIAGYGQLAASLGPEGLIAREVGFGDGEGWISAAEEAEVETLAPYSRTVARSSVHLVNYAESAVPDFIRATTHRELRQNGYQETIISEFDEPSSLLPPLIRLMSDQITADEIATGDRFEVLGNANYRLLVQLGSEVEVLNMLARPDKSLRLNPYHRIKLNQLLSSPIGHAMSTQALASGFLLEHTGGVHIFTDSGVIELAEGLVVQARTFPNSRRYKDTVVLVREDSVDLVGFVEQEA